MLKRNSQSGNLAELRGHHQGEGGKTEDAFAVIIPKERYNNPDAVEAKKAEFENWVDLEAVYWVEDKGQKLISTRWVITENEYPDGEGKPKARLVHWRI